MNVLATLIPVSLLLGGVGLAAFFWSLKDRQHDDPQGDAARILEPDWDDRPKPRQDGPDDSTRAPRT